MQSRRIQDAQTRVIAALSEIAGAYHIRFAVALRIDDGPERGESAVMSNLGPFDEMDLMRQAAQGRWDQLVRDGHVEVTAIEEADDTLQAMLWDAVTGAKQ